MKRSDLNHADKYKREALVGHSFLYEHEVGILIENVLLTNEFYQSRMYGI